MHGVWRKLRRVREPANGLTHLAGAILAVVALVVLLRAGIMRASVQQIIGFSIFGLSLIALYTASTLYHLLPLSPVGLARLRRIDHMMIFVLIAGTYTPVCLIALQGGWGWSLLGIIWGLALAGIVFKICWMRAPNWLSTVFYVLMGWTAVLATPALLRAVPGQAIAWLLAGGIIYSVGALIYAIERPNPFPRFFGAHALWHLFVIAGSACHFWVMFHHIAPLG